MAPPDECGDAIKKAREADADTQGEEFIYVLEGRIEVHSEFYDPVAPDVGEGIYLDSSMGHAYVVAEGFEEALVLGVCSSADDGLMDSLMSLHG